MGTNKSAQTVEKQGPENALNWMLQGDALTLFERLEQQSDWDKKKIDLVYMDPPFLTGTQFTARLSSGQSRGKKTATNSSPVAYNDKFDGIDDFLKMLEPRLVLLRENMEQTGVIWVHLDYRAIHDTKVLCDRVFGRGAFRGEIIWDPGNGARGRGGAVPCSHQTLIVYSRSETSEFRWNISDKDLREPYAQTSQSMHFKNVDEAGRRYRERTIGGKTYRYYADEGRIRGSIWSDLPAMKANTPLNQEGTGYPTQKPLPLLERIIRATSKAGDLVADPMCGSGTTLVAAWRLGRRFIGNDQGDLACSITAGRLKKENVTALKICMNGDVEDAVLEQQFVLPET